MLVKHPLILVASFTRCSVLGLMRLKNSMAVLTPLIFSFGFTPMANIMMGVEHVNETYRTLLYNLLCIKGRFIFEQEFRFQHVEHTGPVMTD